MGARLRSELRRRKVAAFRVEKATSS